MEQSTRWLSDLNYWRNQIGHNLSSLVQSAVSAPSQTGQFTHNPALSQLSVWLLGQCYRLPLSPGEQSQSKDAGSSSTMRDSSATFSHEKDEELLFWLDFRSRIWMTYRSGFPSIADTPLTSDIGWGCMIRCGQSMLANSLLIFHFGRDWRLGMLHPGNEHYVRVYLQIMRWFLDSPAPDSLFSIHALTKVGYFDFDVDIGQWYGPSKIAHVIAKQLNEYSPGIQDANERRLICYVASDASVYCDEIKAIFKGQKSSLLLLLPLRLGTDTLNPAYYASLQNQLRMKTTVGICGGRPNSALYFLGLDTDGNLLHLDPHICQPSITIKQNYIVEDFLSCHCDSIKKTAMSQLDPSLLLGHLFQGEEEFEWFCREMERFEEMYDGGDDETEERQHAQLFSVLEKRISYEGEEYDIQSVDSNDDS